MGPTPRRTGTRRTGTIVELDPHDALGWIELDGGGRVRFGGSALKGFTSTKMVGARVEVLGTTVGYQGVLKAVQVVPLEQAPAAPAPIAAERQRTPWDAFVRDHPRWSDEIEACVPFARRVPPLALPRHPLFGAWHTQICESAPVRVDLQVPTHRDPDPLDPSLADSFAHGRVAFLDEPQWPSCGLCARPLEMCVQLSRAVMEPWILGGRGLVALFCFHCGPGQPEDPRVGYVRLVSGHAPVGGPAASEWQSASSGWLPRSQRITALPPQRLPPGASWYGHRAPRAPACAASALFGSDDLGLEGPFPPDASPEMLDDLRAELNDWLRRSLPRREWGGACLGGVPSWEQRDRTPTCGDHGEMQLLLDYEGGQFFEGALHVFSCRDRACEVLRFVAEF
jgi:hypothetical protein